MEETLESLIRKCPKNKVFRKSMITSYPNRHEYIIIPINTNFVIKNGEFSPNKIPTMPEWNKLTETPPNENFINTNYGIPAGKENGLTILDVDDLNKFEVFLKSVGLTLDYFKKTTWIAKSQKQGVHIYYQYDETIKSCVGNKYIDIMNDKNRYVVCPPSKYTKDRKYTWIHRCNVKEPAREMPNFLKIHLNELIKTERNRRNSEYKKFCYNKFWYDFIIIILPTIILLLSTLIFILYLTV